MGVSNRLGEEIKYFIKAEISGRVGKVCVVGVKP